LIKKSKTINLINNVKSLFNVYNIDQQSLEFACYKKWMTSEHMDCKYSIFINQILMRSIKVLDLIKCLWLRDIIHLSISIDKTKLLWMIMHSITKKDQIKSHMNIFLKVSKQQSIENYGKKWREDIITEFA